jgi:hypothetical protein
MFRICFAQIEFHAFFHKPTIVKMIKYGKHDTTEGKLKHFSRCSLTNYKEYNTRNAKGFAHLYLEHK